MSPRKTFMPAALSAAGPPRLDLQLRAAAALLAAALDFFSAFSSSAAWPSAAAPRAAAGVCAC
eukprot:1342715-Pyramimonas_sp.AAC.1